MTPELLTSREVADVLKVTPRTVHEYRRAGKINAIRLGGPTGPWRFYADSLARFCGHAVTRRPDPDRVLAEDLELLRRLGIAVLPTHARG